MKEEKHTRTEMDMGQTPEVCGVRGGQCDPDDNQEKSKSNIYIALN